MELRVGAVAVARRTFTQEDFNRFAGLSGDDNPIHVDPEFAARTRFGRTVCHGMLLYSSICAALSRELDPAFVQHEQELMFLTPTFAGEEVEIRLEVTGLTPDAGLAELATVIYRPDGAIACQGRTRMARAGAGESAREAGEQHAAHEAASEGVTLKGLRIGQTAQVERVFTAGDLAEYVALTGDTNPAYLAGRSAEVTGLQVPNGLLGGLFSFLLGTRLPGRGTNWLKQRLVFPSPTAGGALARPGDPVTAQVEIVRLRAGKDLVNLRTTCTLGSGVAVCRGEALVLVKDLESARAPA